MIPFQWDERLRHLESVGFAGSAVAVPKAEIETHKS